MSGSTPTSLYEILNREYHCAHCGWDMQLSDATVNEIRAAIQALIPEKQTADGVNKLTSSDFHRGYDAAIDIIQRNFTGQTDNEREQ